VIGFQALRPEPIPSLPSGFVTGTKADEAGLDIGGHLHDGLGNRLARGLELSTQAVEGLLIDHFVFAVARVGIMARAPCKIGSLGMGVPGYRPLGYAISVQIKITAEFSIEFLQIIGAQELTPIQGFLFQFERIGGPQVHPQI